MTVVSRLVNFLDESGEKVAKTTRRSVYVFVATDHVYSATQS